MRSLARSIKNFSADDMTVYAAALSYQLFFSLFPFIIFLLALLGLLNIPGFFDWLLKQSQTVLPGQASGLMKNIVGQIRGQAASGALSLGAVLALWSASAAVRMAMHALNVAYKVEDRPAWKKFPLSLIYTALLAVLILAAAVLMLVGPQLATWIAEQVGLGSVFATVWTWARIPVAVVLLVLVAALVYYLFPNTNQPFKDRHAGGRLSRDRLGSRLFRLLLVRGELRQLQRHLRQLRCDHRAAVLLLHLGGHLAVRRGAQLGGLPPGRRRRGRGGAGAKGGHGDLEHRGHHRAVGGVKPR